MERKQVTLLRYRLLIQWYRKEKNTCLQRGRSNQDLFSMFLSIRGHCTTIKKFEIHRLAEYTHSSNRGKRRKSNINTRIRNNCRKWRWI